MTVALPTIPDRKVAGELDPNAPPAPPLRLVFWETTTGCNLACVHCRRLEVSKETDQIRIQVTDTGIGIPAEHLERIFEPFAQVEQEPSRRTGGTGLGLSVSAQLVNLLGGYIRVESEPGQGTTFGVLLPLRPVKTSSAAQTSPAQASSAAQVND